MQVTQLFIFLGAALLSMLLAIEAQTTELNARPCRPPISCTRSSPRVCVRDRNGICRQFRNICDLLTAPPSRRWTHTRDLDCRNVRGPGGANAADCYTPCPRRLLRCPTNQPGRLICIRTRDSRGCKIVSGNCQLRNQNCFTRPLNNWLRTDRRRCGSMQLGDKTQPCHPLPRPTPATPRPPTRSPPTRSPPTRSPPTRSPPTPSPPTPSPSTPSPPTPSPPTPSPPTPSPPTPSPPTPSPPTPSPPTPPRR